MAAEYFAVITEGKCIEINTDQKFACGLFHRFRDRFRRCLNVLLE
jgi:hypothetical protein